MASMSRKDARAVMAAWRSPRGTNPFVNADSGFAVDRCGEFLGSASCMLSMLSAAAEDAGALLNKLGDSQFDNLDGAIMAGALEGVATLVDLAAFMMGDE